jgi:HSP20 family protein
MAMLPTDPLLAQLERHFDRLRDAASGGGVVMPMDGIRRTEDVVLRFDVPGVEPDSIGVTVDRGVLTVTARREESYAEDERLFVWERPMGEFTRRVYLSEQLDAEHIEAAYDDGVLTVRVPALERAEPRKIEIARGEHTKAITG